jgi:GT2 family glycosyltransferase
MSSHGGTLWSPATGTMLRSTSTVRFDTPTISRSASTARLEEVGSSLDRCARLSVGGSVLAARSCRLVVALSLCSSLFAWALFASRTWHGLSHGRAPWDNRGPARSKRLRVCLVYDGGRAEAGLDGALADLLTALVDSADVTALRLDAGQRSLSSLPERLQAVPDVNWIPLPSTQHVYDGSPAAALSFRTLEWLRATRSYDHLLFHAAGAAGHYPLLARELGLALSTTRVTVLSLAPRQLLWRRRPGAGASLEDLEEDHMQRGMAERADVFLASSAALRFMKAHSWKLPPLVATLDAAAEEHHGADGGARHTGGVRRRGGVEDEDDDSEGGGLVSPEASMQRPKAFTMPRLLLWWKELPRLQRHARRGAGSAAVTLAELSRKLRDIEHGDKANRTAFPMASDGGAASEPWQQRRRGRNQQAPEHHNKLGLADVPLVSVCVVHHERGPLLLQALDSIRAQTLPSHAVQAVVVDDGSTSAAALATLEKLATWHEFRSEQWLLLRRPSRYLGAARNEAARHATGRYLYFLDDDNCLKRHSLLTLLHAAASARAHVLTSVNDKWPQSTPPPVNDDPTTERWLPLGDAAAVGVFKNCFGDASALVRRTTFEALGGFTEDGGVGHEDWELWARAVLRGYRLRVVPEALYWYRVGGRGSMLAESLGGTRLAQAQRHANHARNIRPYLQRLSGWPEAQDAVRLAQGMHLERSPA